MKCFNYLLLLMVLIAISHNYLPAQVHIEITDCIHVKAALNRETSAKIYSFCLEKQISPGVWSDRAKRTKKATQIEYPNLEAGTYRVSVILSIEKQKISSKPFVINPDCKVSQQDKNDAWYTRIYPNPTSGKVYLKLPDFALNQVAELSVFDSSGTLIHTIAIRESQELIDLSSLKTGLFFVQLSIDQEPVYYSKLIRLP